VGRRVFSSQEADEIRQLLRQKSVADRSRQKALRHQLRQRLDFYISDFTDRTDGFTAADFDELVARGTIEISEVLRLDAPPTMGNTVQVAGGPDEAKDEVLPDVLEPGLRVVFCGTAVGATSARVRAYYAGPGNQFWRVLVKVGLTPRVLSPHEFWELPKCGIGLTDLAKQTSGSDADVSASEFDVDATREKIEMFAPKALAFNGKRAAEVFFSSAVEYGRQGQSTGGTAVFVLPSTSAAARGYWDESRWEELADFCSLSE